MSNRNVVVLALVGSLTLIAVALILTGNADAAVEVGRWIVGLGSEG